MSVWWHLSLRLRRILSYRNAMAYLDTRCTDWTVENFDYTPAYPWSQARYRVTAMSFPAHGRCYGHTAMQAAKRAVKRKDAHLRSMSVDLSRSPEEYGFTGASP